jgi:hypothetical protein
MPEGAGCSGPNLNCREGERGQRLRKNERKGSERTGKRESHGVDGFLRAQKYRQTHFEEEIATGRGETNRQRLPSSLDSRHDSLSSELPHRTDVERDPGYFAREEAEFENLWEEEGGGRGERRSECVSYGCWMGKGDEPSR